jgi:hypothetical protein
MPKKSAAAMSEAPAVVEPKTDPTLLGVGLPVKVTVDAAQTVYAAWKESLLALRGAVEDKVKKKPAPSASSSVSEAPVATA